MSTTALTLHGPRALLVLEKCQDYKATHWEVTAPPPPPTTQTPGSLRGVDESPGGGQTPSPLIHAHCDNFAQNCR